MNRIKNYLLLATIGLSGFSALADSSDFSNAPAEKSRYFIEYLESDTGPATVSSWQQFRASPETHRKAAAETRKQQTIDLSYSGSGWSMSLCSRASIAETSGTLSVQAMDSGGYRIFPAAPEGEFSLELSADAIWPESCASIHFDGAHALELNDNSIIPEAGFQWHQKKQLSPAGKNPGSASACPRLNPWEQAWWLLPISLAASLATS